MPFWRGGRIIRQLRANEGEKASGGAPGERRNSTRNSGCIAYIAGRNAGRHKIQGCEKKSPGHRHETYR